MDSCSRSWRTPSALERPEWPRPSGQQAAAAAHSHKVLGRLAPLLRSPRRLPSRNRPAQPAHSSRLQHGNTTRLNQTGRSASAWWVGTHHLQPAGHHPTCRACRSSIEATTAAVKESHPALHRQLLTTWKHVRTLRMRQLVMALGRKAVSVPSVIK
jgi:hypothetical protein